MKIKVMTYNIASGRCYEDVSKIVNHGGAPQDISRCANVIKNISPDICGLNETNIYTSPKIEIKNQPEFIANFTGLNNCFFGKAKTITSQNSDNNRDYGNAVITKYPFVKSEVIPIPDPEIRDENTYYETRSITKTVIDLAGGITVLQTHMGLAISESKNATLKILELLDKIDTPVILMGDFNIRPSNPLIDMLRKRLFDTALVSEGEYLKTFPSYKYPEGVRPRDYTPDCKIDYIFVSSHFKTISIDVPNTSVSDHRPIVVELEI